MTLAEIKSLIDTYHPDNLIGLINPAGERIVLKALADFMVSSQGEADTVPFVYDPAFSYALNAPVIYDNAWFLSLAGANLNNQPDTSPLSWDPVNAFNTVLSIWEADAVYLGTLTIVIKDNKLYLLDRIVVGDDPFVSTNFSTELAAAKWINLLPNSKPVANTYADSATMIAAQGSQVEGYFYKAGTSIYFYLGTTGGVIGDYYEVTGSGGSPTPPVAASYADTSAMIAAQGSHITNYFYKAGTTIYLYLGTTGGVIGDYLEGTGPPGPTGPAGATGPAGPTGPTGPAGPSESDFTASTLPVAFDIPRKYGFTTAITGNFTVASSGAFESSMAKVLHNDTVEPVITPPGGATLVKDGGTYVPSVDNIIYLVCHKNDAGTVTKVSYTITQDNP